jgi:hypothetical protein
VSLPSYHRAHAQLYRRIFVETMVLFLIIIWVAPVTLISFVVSEVGGRARTDYVDRVPSIAHASLPLSLP